MTLNNFVTLKDTNTSPIWNGEEVYILTSSFTISGGAITSNIPKTYQDISQINSETWAENFNRRKSETNYGGYTNQKIILNTIYNPITIGNTLAIEGTIRKIFTPSRLMEIVLKPRVLYLKDEFLIRDLLSVVQDNSPAIYSATGIPVILISWNMVPSLEGKKVMMSLSFTEAKEL